MDVVATVLRTSRLRPISRRKVEKMPKFEVKMTRKQAEREMGIQEFVSKF